MLCRSTKRHPHTSGLLFAPSMRSPGLYSAIDHYTLLINADTLLRAIYRRLAARPQGSLAFSKVLATQRPTGTPTSPAQLVDSLIAYHEFPEQLKSNVASTQWLLRMKRGRLGRRIHLIIECWVGACILASNHMILLN
ncbi:hypothetical protein KVT40_001227 [Elsinoe batatas]|uniref:Uncharacterized protein n=1 Tax=Elsinoe batatas TaxID=2601811 RepID=A0A8K0PL12_9PEZI|nr:hypothetical protein KVT40_001227 [Elsinoe batatas]